MGRRENTFRIDYANVPKRPDNAKVHRFCATVLGLKQGEVLRIQNRRTLGASFVKVVDFELAQRICEEHDNKHEITIDGKSYPLRITLEDGAVEVKLFDLSEDVTDQKIADFLGKYGDVIAIGEQQYGDDVDFPGISTGIRVAKMIVKRNIDSWVTIDGEMTQVSFYGQRQTCRHCHEYIHIGATCVQNKKLLVQKTYADAAKQMAPTSLPSKSTKQLAPYAKQAKAIPSSVAPSETRITKISAKADNMPPPKPTSNRQLQKLVQPPIMSEQNFPPLTSSTMSLQSTNSGPTTSSTGHQPLVGSGTARKVAGSKVDGNETDSSVGSSSSKRHLRTRNSALGKKARVEDDDDDDMRDENSKLS